MVATSAAERLRRAVAIHASAVQRPGTHGVRRAAQTGGELPPIAQILRGEWHGGADGPVFIRDEWFPLDHRHGALPLSSALDAQADVTAMLAQDGQPVRPERLAFFDIETTGLSGGTGTYIVLAGLGSYERAAAGEPLAFRMRQYFLAGLAHEPAMLGMLAEDLARFDGIVTYNGRAFDVPVLDTRLTLSRLKSPCGGLSHIDLLYAVRRLYRHRMAGCRLAEAERRLIRVERPDDVPGWLIPSLYFDYLRAGRAAPLRAVFAHNAEDVLSLVGVLARIVTLLSAEESPPDDAVAVARWWERVGESGRALALYAGALPWLEGGDDWRWAASRLAMLHKRAGELAPAEVLWRRIWQEESDDTAGLELAKHLEHHCRRYDEAATVVGTLLGKASDPLKCDALQHRLNRLTRKLADV